jgi:hypothetical protein
VLQPGARETEQVNWVSVGLVEGGGAGPVWDQHPMKLSDSMHVPYEFPL